jgi:hypothetical protein
MYPDQTAVIRKKTDEILFKINKGESSVEEIEWLENVYRVSAIKKQFQEQAHHKRRYGFALTAITCIILAGFLLFFRVGDIQAFGFLATNNTSIQIKCKALQVSLIDSLRSDIVGFNNPVLTDRLEINNLNSLTVSDTQLSFYDSTPGLNARINADTIFLEKIDLNMPSVLRIRQSGDMIYLTTNGNPVKVSASFNNAEFLAPVKEKVQSVQGAGIPLFARFETTNDENKEVEIKFRYDSTVNLLEGKKINALSFSDAYVYGADILKYISTIQSGVLTLNDVNRNIDLNKQDRLILQNPKGWIIDFSIENGIITLFFKGTVKDIKAGPMGSEKNLSPTLLEYFFKNQPLTLFWGAVVFFWSLLSSIIVRFKSS